MPALTTGVRRSALRAAHAAADRVPATARRARETLQPRRFVLFGVGAPKSGTHSVARVFDARFRAVHEPRPAETIRLLVDHRSSALPAADVAEALHLRDLHVWAECESSHMLAWFADLLPSVFPRARYVVTVRPVRSWVNSVLDQHANVAPPAHFMRLRRHYFGPASTTPGHVLTELDQPPLRALVDYWRRHHEFLLEHLPPDRTVWLATDEIEDRLDDLAAHVGVPRRQLSGSRAHAYTAPHRHDVIGRIDPDEVRATITATCAATADVLAEQPGLTGRDLLGLDAVR